MRKTKEDRKREIIDELVQARHGLVDAIVVLPPERVDEIFIGEWTVKDLVAHLVGWDLTNLAAIREILDGEYPSFFQFYDKDWRSYNASLVKQYKIEPFPDLIAEVQDSHHQLVTFLEALPPEQVINGKARSLSGRTMSIRSLLRFEVRDEQEHTRQVQGSY